MARCRWKNLHQRHFALEIYLSAMAKGTALFFKILMGAYGLAAVEYIEKARNIFRAFLFLV